MIRPGESKTFDHLYGSREVPRSLLGYAYKAGGRGPRDFDCWGLVLAFYAASGIEIPDPRSADIDAIQSSGIFSYFRRLAPEQKPDFGDVAVFNTGDNRYHVGVVTLSGILHATAAGVAIFPRERCRIREFYRLKRLMEC